MNCPHCGAAGTVVVAEGRGVGICAVCGRQSLGQRRLEVHRYRRKRRKSPASCKHRRVERMPTQAAGEVRERCLDCGTDRQVEVER